MANRVRYWLSENGRWINCPQAWRNFVTEVNKHNNYPSTQDYKLERRADIANALRHWDGIYKYRISEGLGRLRPHGYVLFKDQAALLAWLITYE